MARSASTEANTARIVTSAGARKSNVLPLRAAEISALRQAGRLTAKHFCSAVPNHSILFMHKPLTLDERMRLLPRFVSEEEVKKREARKSAKSAAPNERKRTGDDGLVVLSSDDEDEVSDAPATRKVRAGRGGFAMARRMAGGNARAAFVLQQQQRKQAGEQTATQARIQNKLEAVERVREIFNDPRFSSQFTGLRWMYRFNLYWSDVDKRDPPTPSSTRSPGSRNKVCRLRNKSAHCKAMVERRNGCLDMVAK